MTSPTPAPPASFDFVVRAACLVDGTGAPRRRADVGVADGRIAAVGDLGAATAAREIDAGGAVLAPGFIDAHTHDDRAVLSTPDMAAKVSQGVTTVVAGNCGVSLAPLDGRDPPPPLNLLGGREWFRFPRFADYVAEVRAHPAAVNVAFLAGHSALRVAAMDDLGRAASAAEIERMSALLDEALEAGAIGLSTGLAYPPAQAAPTGEVVALCERVRERGGIYATHMRDERDGVVDSVRETVEIGRRAGVPVVISHHKCSGRANWGRTRETLPLIAEARRAQRVDLDVYPYTASSTVLLAEWVGEAERVRVTWSVPHPEMAGRDLDDVAAAWDCAVDEAVGRLQPAGAIYFQMDEGDLRRVLGFEDAMIGSDGLPHDAVPHPRLWGTFPRVLGRYARDLGVLGLEEAVRRMTGVPARVFGLEDRGVVRPGAAADLVLFDPDTVADRADYDHPTEPAAGIREVLVAGRTVWRDGEPGGERPGRVLRRAAAARA